MSKQELIVLALASLLFAVWPVPHTTTLRELLLLIGVCAAGYFYWRNRAVVHGPWWRELRVPLALFAALSVWMLLVALFVSPEPLWSLNELRSQWLKATMALALGGLVAGVSGQTETERRRLIVILIAVLLFHMIAIDVEALTAFARKVAGHRAVGFTDGVDKANYLTNIALAILIAEALTRLLHGKRLLPVPGWAVCVAALVALYSLHAERIRNGVGAVVVMLLCAVLIYLAEMLRRRMALKRMTAVAVIAIVFAAVSMLVMAGSAKPGANWRQFIATVPVALDTQSHKGWINEQKYGLPTLPDGKTIDASAYVRIAWFKEGLVLAREHPLGVGFGRNAFGHAITAKYNEPKGHSHSSFIDLLVGIGIPGMLLWLGFLGSLLWLAQRNFAGGGYVLFFVVVD
ncbi:MAG TPA: O-antigen ligase family protein, partial [Burkholderiaceae bacterium]|nr:O-antigen ligase family protein [Burkholderiaceae bacterium]